jgi:predicted amidohydrolase
MRVAVVQMNSAEDKAQNLSTAERLLHEAADRQAELAVLPELFTYLGRRRGHREAAEAIPGPTSELLARVARQRGMRIVGGAFSSRSRGKSATSTHAWRSRLTARSLRATASSICSTSTSKAIAIASRTPCRRARTWC